MSLGTKIAAGFTAGLVIVAAIAGSAYVSTQRLIEANRRVTHTHQVIEGLGHLLSMLDDAETGQRGFIVTGEEKFLDPYDAAVGRVQPDIDALVALTADNPAQQESLRQVRKLADGKLAWNRETIQLRRKSGLEAAAQAIRTDRGKKLMDDLRGVIAEMASRERRLLEERNAAASASADRTIATIAVWLPAALLVLGIAVAVLMRSMRYRGPVAPLPQPRDHWGRITIRYASAVAVVAVAAVVQGRLWATFGPLPTFVMFYPAVLLVATVAGGGPAILATLLSALAADYWFLLPYGSLAVTAPNDMLALAIFTSTSLCLSVLADRLRRSRWLEAVNIAQEQQLDELSRLNEELTQQSEELSQQSEELAQQNEELTQQSEELAQRNEELHAQSEEIQTLNTELTNREDMLQKLLDAARLAAAEETVLGEICTASLALFGPTASAVFVYEKRDGQLVVRAQAGIDPEAAGVAPPLEQSFADLVIGENKTACLPDAALRPDIVFPCVSGKSPFRAVLAAPMRDGTAFGAVGVYSRQPQEWTAEQFRLAEWLAGQCAHILETLRLQADLQRAKLAAEEAARTKGQFLANISHELRTPMNAILGMMDVALPKTEHPVIKDCLETAKGSAELLLSLLDDLLDTSKIEAGKLELESAPFSLRRMLDQVTRVLNVRASERGLLFSCRMPEKTPPAVVGDQLRLQQVLLNLGGNAVKFTDHGEVEMRLDIVDGEAGEGLGTEGMGSTESQTEGAEDSEVAGPFSSSNPQSPIPNPSSPPPSVCLKFSVRDTGIGIPPSRLEHIFEPFAQADASMTRRFGGTGLGLSISKSLVEMIGGRLWAESEEGKGSTFHVALRLPLAKELPAEPGTPAVSGKAAVKLRLLLAEDNPANQKLASYILQDRGHVVEIAGDGREAIELTQMHCYDVILMDVQMPELDGLQATAAIRAAQKNSRRVPIIAMTAHAMVGDRERCLAGGMDGYLSKPINGPAMIALIESLAAKSSGKPPAAAAPREALPEATSAVFDPREALIRCFHSDDMLQQMIQCFFDEVKILFPQMRAALQNGDLTALGQLGHRMKGTVVYLGAGPATDAARDVERFERTSGGRDEAAKALDALERECLRLEIALREYEMTVDPQGEGEKE